VEILSDDTSTKRSSNQAPFDTISKSGDGGGSGGSLYINLRQLTYYIESLDVQYLKEKIY
jgi:hypothetical protein